MNTSFIILACSGPRAMRAILLSNTIGDFRAAMGGVITLTLVHERCADAALEIHAADCRIHVADSSGMDCQCGPR